MGIFGDFFDFDGDWKTGMFDIIVANELFDIFNEYCELKEKQREQQSGKCDVGKDDQRRMNLWARE